MSTSNATSWLSYLNTVQPAADMSGSANGGGALAAGGESPLGSGFLSDDLRSQLEAWTTVTFDDPTFHEIWQSNLSPQAGADLGAADFKPEPSPYAKRPFGLPFAPLGANKGSAVAQQLSASGSSTPQALERGFNAFAPETASLNGFAALENIGVGVDGSDTLFASAAPFATSPQTSATPSVASAAASPDVARASLPAQQPRGKKRTLSSSTPPSSTSSTSNDRSAAVSGNAGYKIPKQPLLTKAAILAAQAAEIESQQVSTPEEEAARQAELNRIAAEDDKRRRNTAASARFRVKKKQREQALEENVKELCVKIEKLEKDLEAAKVENNFLRDLVIRKVGLTDLPASSNRSSTGKISGGQEGATGMGTA